MNVAKRLRAIIAQEVNARTRYLTLQDSTGIKTDTWKNFWFERREADVNMLEAVARLWPQYAYWLATGATDAVNGHFCPTSELQIEPSSITNKGNVSDLPYLKAGVDVVKSIELIENPHVSEEEKTDAYRTIERFIDGAVVHNTKEQNWGLIDSAFKSIKQFTKIRKLRVHEREEQLQK